MSDVIYFLLHVLLAGALVYGFTRSCRHFLYVAALLIPLQGLALDFVVNLSWYKLIFPVGLLGALLFRQNRLRIGHLPGRNVFLLFIAYVCLLTGIQWMIDIGVTGWSDAGARQGWGLAQSTYHYPVQLVSFIWVWGLILIGFWFTKSIEDLNSVINGYVIGNILSITAGFYQMIASPFGLPWPNDLEYTRFLSEGSASRSALSLPGLHFDLYRLYGLGGEPKHTASFAIIAISLMAAQVLFPSKFGISRAKVKLFILICGLLATASTGGWVAFVLIGIYYLTYGLSAHPGRVLSYFMITALAIILLAGFLGSQLVPEIYQLKVSDRLYDLESVRKYEPKDGAFLLYAQAHPESLIFGHGTGGVDFRLIPYAPDEFVGRGGTLTPTYLPTRLLGDVGLIGTIILAFLWRKWMVFLRHRGDTAAVHFIVASSLALLVMSQVALAGYLLICSSMIAAFAHCRSDLPSQSG